MMMERARSQLENQPVVVSDAGGGGRRSREAAFCAACARNMPLVFGQGKVRGPAPQWRPSLGIKATSRDTSPC